MTVVDPVVLIKIPMLQYLYGIKVYDGFQIIANQHGQKRKSPRAFRKQIFARTVKDGLPAANGAL